MATAAASAAEVGTSQTSQGGLAGVPALVRELEGTPSCALEPLSFFVSWQGVLTLAYKGLPPALLDLKRRMQAAHPALPPENPGSRWPKTSLGCLRDGARLTPEQLATLNSICKEESARCLFNGEFPPQLTIDSAAVVLYECRSLEQVLSVHSVPFLPSADLSPSSPEEQERVRLIVGDAVQPGYWFHASRDGNREAHYCAPALGATLVHPLAPAALLHTAAAGSAPGSLVGSGSSGEGRTQQQQQVEQQQAQQWGLPHGGPHPALLQRGLREVADRQALLAAARAFRQRVDAELPGMYRWFAEGSLHVTLRALMG